MEKEDALNMSLDDIIKRNSKKNQKPRENSAKEGVGKERNRKFRRGGLRRNGRGRNESVEMEDATKSLKVVINNGIAKPGRRRDGRRFARGGYEAMAIVDAPRDLEALEGSGKWKHDMYDGEPRQRRSLRDRLAGDPTGATLIVENLNYNVNHEDVVELFDTVGPLRYAELQYDRSGRSEGVAKVVFIKPEDAKKAFDQYNNVALDGQPMKITVHRARPQEAGRTLSSGIRVEQPRRGFMRPGGQNRMASRAFQAAPGGRGGNRNARPRGTRPLRARRTKEELDAELDTMMAHE